MTSLTLTRTACLAVTRTGRFVVQWGALASSWCLRLTSTAAFLGVLVGIAGQFAIVAFGSQAADSSLEPTIWQRVVGVAVTALAYALIGFFVSLISASWLRLPLGRVLGVSLFTGVFTLVFAANVVSTVIRVLSGTHMTVGAVEFLMSSPDHFAHAALDGYAWSVRAAACAVVLFAIATAIRTASTVRAPGAPRFRAVTALLAVLLLSVVGWAGSAQATLDYRVFASTAELAFARSVRSTSGLSDVAAAAGDGAAVPPEVGPPRSSERLWELALAKQGDERPNVLLLTLESVSYRHLGFEGYRRGVTPNLDALAKAGLRFRRAWTTATHSNYAQMAILSSLFPRRGSQLDMYHNLDYPRLLPHDLFHRLGYTTATISSQDETWQGMRRFQQTDTPTEFWHARDHQGPFIDTGTERIVPDEITVTRIKRWLDNHKGAPWSLYVNLQCTHFPYKLPEHASRPFHPDEPNPASFTYLRYPEAELEVVKNRYDNALAYVDRQIGRLRNHLRAIGEYDNTLWVITSDHGEMFHQHGMVTHGKSLYDAESRVPLILHWPKRIKPGETWEPASHLDIMPTVAELVGVPAHPSYQGRSLLHPPGDARPAVFMNIQGLRFADGVVCYPWKFMYDVTGQQAFLFNLDRDPEEATNLLREQPRVAASLASLIQAQIDAQLEYHAGENGEREEFFQPRLGVCPSLP
jgi:arylsulfatase A-like enzyme